jgi:hypothetical protein
LAAALERVAMVDQTSFFSTMFFPKLWCVCEIEDKVVAVVALLVDRFHFLSPVQIIW